MADNIFQKATKLAATALELLKLDVKLPSLFTIKLGKADFTGAAGDVVGIKRPPILVARDKGWRNDDPIVVDRIAQTKIQVKLDKFPVQAVHLSPEEATLDEVEFVRDIQAPQVQSMVTFFEKVITATLRAASFVLEVAFTPGATDYSGDPRKVALRARKLLNDAWVPDGGRYWLVGSSVSEQIAGHEKLLAVDTSGLPEALREGVVGKLGGFIVIEVQALGEDESYFVHSTAVALANVAPVVPRGAVSGASVTANGMAVTQIFDYDSTHAKDRSIVESFLGAGVVTDPERDDEGAILFDDDEPRMQFVRAVKVIFGAVAGVQAYTVQVTGGPTGGEFTLTVDGETTDPIAHNATNAAIASALNALEGVAGVKVTGSATKTVKFTEYVTLTAATSLTGGDSPDVEVTAA
ncbi:P22 phage major capsid protein family protein [Homoserinibacter sp. GY 40078]|uniref:P22 phage major capsid protein family protein n=1 Tax=Homoserinibacter sp. GY 40078 TaxID=2603275 RepID=UPI0011CAFB74|nr:P22 phage major capsid protein family protein [Homoserinibacter sp. GY 40078]TXK17401.1 hypothetical protein FVQ89_11240 [Homoserinibacter sp. GY 40078]